MVLGHAYEPVLEKIREGLEIGNAFAMTHEYEISAAEKIKKLANVDLVRFANSGTEATMHAIRIARAFTGREKVLKFEGAYHGFHDYTLWNCQPPVPGVGYRRSPVLVPHGSGIPYMIGQLVFSIPFNDEELLEKKVKEKWGEIGYQKIAHGGTYCANVVATAAADAVLDEIEAGALEKVDAHGKLLMEGFNHIFKSLGIPGVVQGPPSMCGVLLTEKEKVTEFRDWNDSDNGLYEEVIRKCIEKGVMPDIDSREPWFVSASHSDEDAAFALGVFEEALKEVIG